jgi:hypothetical protein
MRYRRAIEKIRILAEACEDFKCFPSEEPFLLEAYVFGDVLRGSTRWRSWRSFSP